MTDIAHPTTTQAAPAPTGVSSTPAQQELSAVASELPARASLRRAFGELAAGTSRLAQKLSPAQIVALVAGLRGESPEQPSQENTAKEGEVPKCASSAPLEVFSLGSFTEKMVAMSLAPLRRSAEAILYVRSLLTPQTTETVFIKPEARLRPRERQSDDTPLVRPSSTITQTPKALVDDGELQPPKDRKQSAVAAALEQVESHFRRKREEAKESAEDRAEEERRRKISSGRDALLARDLQNGIRSPEVDEIIDQIEGPFAISVETALGRIDDVNRAEKEEALKRRKSS